jgi:hypothetical protein
VFLRIAQNAMRDPLHPNAFSYAWDSDYTRRVSSFLPTGPTTPYLLMPVVLLGSREWLGHSVQLLLLLASVVAVASIALRSGYGESTARLAGILLVGSPIVLAMTATCMPDTASMALATIGIERLLAFRERPGVLSGVASAFFLTASTLARTHMILVLAPAFCFAIDALPGKSRRPVVKRLVSCLPILVVPALAWGVMRLTRDPAGGADIAYAAQKLASGPVVKHIFVFCQHQTLAVPLAAGIAAARFRRLLRGRALWFALPAAVALADYAEIRELPLVLAAGLGLAALLDSMGHAIVKRNASSLALASWLLLAVPVIVYVHLPAKYLVGSAPAAALIVAHALAQRAPRTRAWLSTFVVGAGIVFGLAIVRADARLSGLGRRVAQTLVKPAVQSGQRVWFAGDWGFKWYMEEAGARPLVDQARPTPGDLIVVSQNMHGSLINQIPYRLVTAFEADKPGGRLMSGGAGFYSDAWGLYPWVWANSTDEHIEVRRAQ